MAPMWKCKTFIIWFILATMRANHPHLFPWNFWHGMNQMRLQDTILNTGRKLVRSNHPLQLMWKSAKTNHFGCQPEVFSYGVWELATKNLWLALQNDFFCTFSHELQWMFGMDKFSFTTCVGITIPSLKVYNLVC